MTNREDIERGKAQLEAGQAVRYADLREGDRILGVGTVTYVHIFNGGISMRLGIDDAHYTIKRADAKVSIEPRPGGGQ